MSCVMCQKELTGMTVCVGTPECRHHLSHLRCYNNWESQVDSSEGNKCPKCPNSNFRPLIRNFINTTDGSDFESEEEENGREERENHGGDEESENDGRVESENQTGVEGGQQEEDVEEHPILDGQVLYSPARQKLPQKLSNICPICFQVCPTTVLKHKHIDTKHEPRKRCQLCGASCTRKDNLVTHSKKCHSKTKCQKSPDSTVVKLMSMSLEN